MQDEILSVNSIVEKHAADNPLKTENAGEQSQQKIENQDLENKGADAAAEAEKLKQQNAEANPLADFLKKHNVESLEALEEKLKPKEEDKVLSPEEKAKQENLYNAKLQAFAVEKGLMQLDDFGKLKTVKEQADTDLVFADWKEEHEEDNLEDFIKDYENDNEDELTGLSEAEIKEKAKAEFDIEAKKAFDKKFKLNSEDDKVKAKGLEKIAKLAASKRSPLENSYKAVKESFDTELDIRNNYPNYDKTVRGFVNESIPEKFVFYKGKDGDADIDVDIELSKEDKAEIAESVAKKTQTDVSYLSYKKGDLAALKTLVEKETNSFIEEKYKEQGKKLVADKFLGIGYAKGQIGAKNSFALNQGNRSATDKIAPADAAQQVLNSLQGKK